MRNDRDNHVGGVLIYYKESLLAHQVTTWDHPNLEATGLNVTVRSQSFLVGCIYRPPSDCSFFDVFRNRITKIWMKRKNIILAGDFNCDMTPSVESNASHFGRRFRRILRSYGLKDIINSPTRIISDSKSLIDLIVTSQPAKVQTSGSTDLGISDHHFIFSVFEGARSNPKPLVISTKKYKKMEKSNLTKILSVFLGILWVCLMIVTSSGTTLTTTL